MNVNSCFTDSGFDTKHAKKLIKYWCKHDKDIVISLSRD
jgi:hypothetical protein